MTYKLKKNFTKEDIDKVLEKIAKKKKGIDRYVEVCWQTEIT